MELRILEAFCRVYEARSFSRAAERLDLTQPTVSAHIRSLEEELGCRVFDRLGRKIEATRAAHLLYRHARELLDRRRLMVEEMDRFLHRLEGNLEVGASTIPGEYLLPPLIGRFHERYPKIAVTLEIRDTQAVVGLVKEGRIEVGFVGARVAGGDLEFRRFAVDRLVLVAPAAGDWAGREAIGLEELREVRFLTREAGSGTRMIFERKLQELEGRLEDFHIVAELGSTSAVKEAVKAGLGVAVLSHLAVQTELEAGILRVVPIREIDGLERRFYRVVSSRRARSPLCEAFLAFLDAGSEGRRTGAGEGA